MNLIYKVKFFWYCKNCNVADCFIQPLFIAKTETTAAATRSRSRLGWFNILYNTDVWSSQYQSTRIYLLQGSESLYFIPTSIY